MPSHTRKLLIASSVALLPLAAAQGEDAGKGSKTTSASVAALKASLGNPPGLEVNEVRVTSANVACIDYQLTNGLSNGQGGKTVGHAVVQGQQVLKSPPGDEGFETAWNKHCLGPRGGITSGGGSGSE